MPHARERRGNQGLNLNTYTSTPCAINVAATLRASTSSFGSNGNAATTSKPALADATQQLWNDSDGPPASGWTPAITQRIFSGRTVPSAVAPVLMVCAGGVFGWAWNAFCEG